MAMKQLNEKELKTVNGGLDFEGWVTGLVGAQAAEAIIGAGIGFAVGGPAGAVAGMIEGYYAGTASGLIGSAIVDIIDG